MADDALKQRIRGELEKIYSYDPGDAVSVTDSDESDENVHVVVVSQKFEGKRTKEKIGLIQSQLYQSLPPEDWGKITLSIGISPEELKAL